jgi:2-phosphoglycerate kinase
MAFDYSQFYWIGGSPCSGKSSVAEALSVKHRLRLVKTDDYLFSHRKQADPIQQPVMHRLAGLSWNEIWMAPVERQVQDEFEFYREEFPILLHELAVQPGELPLLVEGAALLPELLNRLGVVPGKIVYLIPTRNFQIEHYANRPWIQEIVNQCDRPEIAFSNWMERDARFGEAIAGMAEQLGMPVILVDRDHSLDANIALVDRLIHW